ncbi:23S rRNA (uracil(1939)-C(5))-methyltransferase RlmD [Acholeplasma hippikon]|uniref:tRNA (Uracil-5-)-methyltransferase related enzyme n=1 Tax=Acholeplasma hippikon TaxID=264636 RepID=A0A449BHZ4_9MOLU|nr:23S rRNA (uracil(1939)-C(5))-methyltransferase RlmD [Acholeplasma hippikon]VEU82033.1 tRNA (uracil-5-)-methyltransferase related enzyme [Acholeplasma hippikon]
MEYKINDILEVTAYEVDRFGQGVSKVDDIIIFTPGLLKDEKAQVTIIDVKSKFLQAKIKKLLTTSPERKTMTSKLGALDLYHLKDDKQNDWQAEITAKEFKRSLGYEAPLGEVIQSEKTLNYRNKVVYHVLDDEMMRLGLYTTTPIELVEVHTFILNSHAIQRCIAKIQQQSIKVDPKVFKHIMLRSNEKEEVLVTLVAYEKEFTGLKELVEKIKTFKEVVGITLNIKPNEKTILGNESYTLYGKNELTFTEGSLKLKINDRSFMQVNLPVMIKTYERIASEINGETVIDCYSGIGSIGYFIGKNAKRIVMIESNKENIKMANDLKPYYQGSFEIRSGLAEQVLPKLDAEILVIDPPRAGLHKSLLTVLNQKQFKKIIYLSCELNTLTRDLKVLRETYKLKEVIPVRMFPQTTSIETLVILER